ncbi:ICU11 [Symbiodinium sp. CCMP2456]|nr:ICU11 [Symbiodinium sp. CCMP2456]
MARRFATRALLLLSCSREGRSSVPPFSPAGTALEAARQLVRPKATLQKDGEFEGGEFWEAHEELLKRAWQEHGPLHTDLYNFGPVFERRYLSPKLRAAVRLAREEGREEALQGLFEEILPGVFASEDLFTAAFRKDFLEELERINSAGIPTRRPNGMNRYGVILDQVGFEKALDGLVDTYIKPLGGMLFPELVGAHDADEHYAFTVKYEPTGDTELAKHGDASVVTLNLCLGPTRWEGGALRFFDSGGSGIYALPKGNASAGSGDVNFRPGQVLIHRGQHKHQALPLLAGQRSNLIIWLHAEYGVVRVAPYAPEQQLTPQERWQQTPRFRLDL